MCNLLDKVQVGLSVVTEGCRELVDGVSEGVAELQVVWFLQGNTHCLHLHTVETEVGSIMGEPVV